MKPKVQNTLSQNTKHASQTHPLEFRETKASPETLFMRIASQHHPCSLPST